MKKVLLKLIIGILIFSCSTTKTGKEGTRYFDENNVEISKSKFDRIRSTNKLLDIPGDYISYFGEFGKVYVWEATQLMNK